MQKFHRDLVKGVDYKIISSYHNRELGIIKGKYHLLKTQAVTQIGIKLLSNDKEYFGSCFCSVKDQFSKKKGFKIALGRALKNAYKKRKQKITFLKG